MKTKQPSNEMYIRTFTLNPKRITSPRLSNIVWEIFREFKTRTEIENVIRQYLTNLSNHMFNENNLELYLSFRIFYFVLNELEERQMRITIKYFPKWIERLQDIIFNELDKFEKRYTNQYNNDYYFAERLQTLFNEHVRLDIDKTLSVSVYTINETNNGVNRT